MPILEHYISPNWYPSKLTTHKEVPTWNYRSVHITGDVSLLNEHEHLNEILSKQTADFEASQTFGHLMMRQKNTFTPCAKWLLAFVSILTMCKNSLN